MQNWITINFLFSVIISIKLISILFKNKVLNFLNIILVLKKNVSKMTGKSNLIQNSYSTVSLSSSKILILVLIKQRCISKSSFIFPILFEQTKPQVLKKRSMNELDDPMLAKII